LFKLGDWIPFWNTLLDPIEKEAGSLLLHHETLQREWIKLNWPLNFVEGLDSYLWEITKGNISLNVLESLQTSQEHTTVIPNDTSLTTYMLKRTVSIASFRVCQMVPINSINLDLFIFFIIYRGPFLSLISNGGP